MCCICYIPDVAVLAPPVASMYGTAMLQHVKRVNTCFKQKEQERLFESVTDTLILHTFYAHPGDFGDDQYQRLPSYRRGVD